MTEDKILTRKMEARAKHAAEHALKHYTLRLDYSDEGIQKVETILGDIEQQIPKSALGRLLGKVLKKLSDEEVENLCDIYGAFIGEAFRAELGGYWYMGSPLEGLPVMPCLSLGDHTVFPTAKTWKRLYEGASDDVAFYYQTMKAAIRDGLK